MVLAQSFSITLGGDSHFDLEVSSLYSAQMKHLVMLFHVFLCIYLTPCCEMLNCFCSPFAYKIRDTLLFLEEIYGGAGDYKVTWIPKLINNKKYKDYST